MKIGTDYALEEAANALLRKAGAVSPRCRLNGTTSPMNRLALRQSREVLNITGVADESLYSGLYRRAFNPGPGSDPSDLTTTTEKELGINGRR